MCESVYFVLYFRYVSTHRTLFSLLSTLTEKEGWFREARLARRQYELATQPTRTQEDSGDDR